MSKAVLPYFKRLNICITDRVLLIEQTPINLSSYLLQKQKAPQALFAFDKLYIENELLPIFLNLYSLAFCLLHFILQFILFLTQCLQ